MQSCSTRFHHLFIFSDRCASKAGRQHWKSVGAHMYWQIVDSKMLPLHLSAHCLGPVVSVVQVVSSFHLPSPQFSKWGPPKFIVMSLPDLIKEVQITVFYHKNRIQSKKSTLNFSILYVWGHPCGAEFVGTLSVPLICVVYAIQLMQWHCCKVVN